MASMVDVVFLLLIFFMCTSTFELPESNLAAQMPQPAPNSQVPQDDFPPIHVYIQSTGEGILIMCDETACPSFNGLTRLLRQRRAIADIPVLIHGDQTVPFESMVAALESCRNAELSQVAFWAPEGN